MNILRVKRKCLELLGRVEDDQAYVHLLLQQEANSRDLAPDEYPVLVQLVRGVLEQQTALDARLSTFLPAGLASLPAYVQHVLRLGAYQIVCLDRVKKKDVVFESVELIKGGKFQGFAGLVNAVLRKIDATSSEAPGSEDVKASQNFPKWLIARWTAQFDMDEVERFCEAANEPLPVYLRVRTGLIDRDALRRRLEKEGVVSEPADYSLNSLRVRQLPKHIRINQLPSYKEGLFFVQDLSSTLVADIVSNNTPGSVCDLCAAPGGKTCSIALSLEPSAREVYASDRSARRVALIQDLVERLRLRNVHCFVHDAVEPMPEREESFEAVLVDAPCSGFGTVGRKIDARWSKSEEIITELVGVQGQLLDRAASLVARGGSLIYSTCTIDKAENEEVLTTFLERHPDFVVADLRAFLPPELCTAEGYYRAWPHRHAMAGAFAAQLKKRG